ncbi:MAG: hypothetical protein IPG76_23755 [Acidobacteria bacterium]|nr:hypothetical protein [Acidobacteriota bacterium]
MSMDLALEAWVNAVRSKSQSLNGCWGAGRDGSPESLKLLFTGYNGTRNTGADVRVEEMLRQIRHVVGEDKADFSVLSQNFELTKGYFTGVKQVRLPDIFPPHLYREVPQFDGVGWRARAPMFRKQIRQCLDDDDGPDRWE